MPRLVSIVATIITSGFLFGCYTPPHQYNPPVSEVLNQPKNVVWDKVIQYFALNDLDIKSLEKNSDIIQGQKIADSKSADCGGHNFEEVMEIKEEESEERPMMIFSVYIKEMGPSKTLVTVHNHAGRTQTFQPMRGDSDVVCTSKGALENDFLGFMRKN